MTFRRGCSHLLIVSLVILGSLGSPAQEPNSTQAHQDDQGQDPLNRPLKSHKRSHFQGEKASKHYRDWAREVQTIITPEELSAFKKLNTDIERDNFIELFWRHRDPPGAPENEYKEEFYRRKAYANERFSAGIPGELTDRGRMYILYGKPDSVETHPMGGPYMRTAEEGGGTTETYPFEIWRYRHLEGIDNEVIMEFVDTCGCGEYRRTINESDKDALLHVPNAGQTDPESMGLSTKAARLTDPLGLSSGLFSQNNGTKALERLQQYFVLDRPPALPMYGTHVSSIMRYNVLPFDVRVDFVRATSDTVLVPITVQVPNRELTFVGKDGVQRGMVSILGSMTTLTGKVAQTFEDTVRVDIPPQTFERLLNNVALYWKALPVRPGRYRLDIVVKDLNGDKLGSFSRGILAPAYEEDKLAASTLILADVVEPVAAAEVGTGNFVIGAMKVRPKVESAGKPVSFRRDQKVNLWMQVYNLAVDEKTGKSAATVQYEVVSTSTNEPVIKMNESAEHLGNQEVNVQKSLPLNALRPGEYQVTVKVNDAVLDRSISNTARFVLE